MNKVELEDTQNQIENSRASLSLLEKQTDYLKRRLGLVKESTQKYRKMNKSGYVSDEIFNNSFQSELALSDKLQELLRAQMGQRDQIEKLDAKLKLLPQNLQLDNAKLKISISDINREITQLQSQKSYIIRAVKSGIITNLQAQEGLQANSKLSFMSIIPENSDIEVRLLVPVRAVGFVKEGQSIDIRYDAFPYQKFGLYSGTISSVSESVLLPNEVYTAPLPIAEAVYLVKAKLDRKSVSAYGKNISLKPGMTLSADIALSKRSIMEWIFEPLLSLKGRL